MQRKKNVFKAYKLMGIRDKNKINDYIRTDENGGHELIITLIKQYKELEAEALRLEGCDVTPITSLDMPVFKCKLMIRSIGIPRQYIFNN